MTLEEAIRVARKTLWETKRGEEVSASDDELNKAYDKLAGFHFILPSIKESLT